MTGNAPGKPRHVGQVCVFGSAPNSTGQAQNIFDRVLSWTCTSRPMVTKYILEKRFQISELGRAMADLRDAAIIATNSFDSFLCASKLSRSGNLISEIWNLELLLRRIIQRLLQIELFDLLNQR